MSHQTQLEKFIRLNRFPNWESEYENGQYCISEEKVKGFFETIIRVFELQKKQAPLEMVKEFHEKFGVPIVRWNGTVTKERCELRMELIKEESREVIEQLQGS